VQAVSCRKQRGRGGEGNSAAYKKMSAWQNVNAQSAREQSPSRYNGRGQAAAAAAAAATAEC
jgi:hypothetical protein